eukprot:5019842-Alexandrium_andersonii.AAC.1
MLSPMGTVLGNSSSRKLRFRQRSRTQTKRWLRSASSRIRLPTHAPWVWPTRSLPSGARSMP